MTSRTKKSLYHGLSVVPETHGLSLLLFIAYAIWHSPYILLIAIMFLFSPVLVMVLVYFDHRHHSYVPDELEFVKAVETAFTQNILIMPVSITSTWCKKSRTWVYEKTEMLVKYQKHALCFGLKRVPSCHFISVMSVIAFLQTQESDLIFVALALFVAPVFMGLWSLFFFDHHGFQESDMPDSIRVAILLNVVTWVPYVIILAYVLLVAIPFDALMRPVEQRVRRMAY